jgi:hypothetical protein
MLLFNPSLQEGKVVTVSQKYIPVEAAYISFHGLLFTYGQLYRTNVDMYLSGPDDPHWAYRFQVPHARPGNCFGSVHILEVQRVDKLIPERYRITHSSRGLR